MSLSIGIIGLPNVGKSTLFNALLKRQAALAANYPFATIEPNVGVVDVPDPRLDRLVEIVQSDWGRQAGDKPIPGKIVPATIKFYDIAGLVKGAHEGEGLGNEFLGHIRSVDAIVHVVRDFTDSDVVETGTGDLEEDIEIIDTELILADLQQVEKQIGKLEKEAKSGKDKEIVQKHSLLLEIKRYLEEGKREYVDNFDENDKTLIDQLSLLTSKPVIRAINVGESQLKSLPEKNNNILNTDRIYISAKIESELSSLADSDQKLFMADLGIPSSGLDLIIQRGYKMLNLQTYFTAGPKEVHAWQIQRGSTAPQAAGKIHSDFERGFISAEVVSYKDVNTLGTYKNAKDKGVTRLEGKNYIVQDGDIILFRFSV